MKHFALTTFFLFFSCLSLVSQSDRGLVVPSDSSTSSVGNTFALVVGISDYPYLRPLNYAAEDAMLFYEFLRSSSGGNVPATNIRLLVNEEATAGGIMSRGISWLQNTAQPQAGDRIYFYLAGHGDAVDASEAYFLAYDANPAGDKNNYSVSGTINMQILKNRIKKFVQQGVQVILIVDACRTSDIPGGRNGLAGNYESIIEAKSGELMFISASPNEYSYEDKRWGNGHGLFTWHLINGLAGAADEDKNREVNTFELEAYVKGRVRSDSKEIGGYQTPVFCCSNHNDIIVGRYDSVFQSKIKTVLAEGVDEFTSRLSNARSANDLFDFNDTNLQNAFYAIKTNCKSKSKVGFEMADSIYVSLQQSYQKNELALITDFYVGALLDEAQRAVNAMLYDEQDLMENFDPCDYYETHHNYLKKAIDLSPSFTPQIKTELENRLAFLETKKWNDGKRMLTVSWSRMDKKLTYKIDNQQITDTNGLAIKESIGILQQLILQGYQTPAIYMCQSELYEKSEMFEDAAFSARLALQRAPSWPRPYEVIIRSFVNAGEIDSAEYYALKRFAIDTTQGKYARLCSFYDFETNDTLNLLKYSKLSLQFEDLHHTRQDYFLLRYYSDRGAADSALYYYRMRNDFEWFPYKSLLRSGRYLELIDSVEFHLEMGDTSHRSLAVLFFVFDSILKDTIQAKKYFKLGLEYSPLMWVSQALEPTKSNNPAAYFYLSIGEVAFWVNNPSTEQYLKTGLEQLKDTGNAYYQWRYRLLLLKYFRNIKAFDKALAHLDSEEYESMDCVDYIHLAETCIELGLNDRAIEALALALNEDPYWHSRMFVISKLYERLGDNALAEEYGKIAYELGYHPRRENYLDVLMGTVVNPECQ